MRRGRLDGYWTWIRCRYWIDTHLIDTLIDIALHVYVVLWHKLDEPDTYLTPI